MKFGKIEGNDYNNLIMNDAINAFRIAVGDNISLQSMVDMFVDEYEDETGVDTGSSINILYDSTNDYYSMGEGDTTAMDNMEYATDGDAQTAYVATDSTNFQSYSEDTIKEQGSYSLKMVATQTDSLNEILTKTFSTPIDLSDRDTIKFKARATRTGTNLRTKIYQQSESDVKLLLHCEGINGATFVKDYSQSNHSSTFIGTAQLKTDNKKWGNSSIWFDGDDDYLEIPDSTDWDIFKLTSDDWTIDFWVKFNDYDSLAGLISQSENSDNVWMIAHGINGFYCMKRTNQTYDLDTGDGGKISDNDWHHVALCKVANEYAIYVDGIQVNYTLDNDTDTYSGALRLGYYRHGAINSLNGYMDGVRIIHSNIFNASPNVGKTDTITVPTSAYNIIDISDIIINSANTWEEKTIDISSIANIDKDELAFLELEIINADLANTIYLDEMYSYANATGFTLISENQTAVSEPDEARIVVLMEEVSAITLNTDLKAWASKDDGITWAQVTLEDVGDYGDSIKILYGEVDLTQSGIGSGTDIVYKLTTHNSKNCKIHGTSPAWR